MSETENNCSRIPPDWGSALSEADYSDLSRSWITRELAESAMLRRVDDATGRQITGYQGNGDCNGILIPYYRPGEPRPFSYRLRRSHPDFTNDKDGRPKARKKYLAAINSGNRLYVPPSATLEQLADANLPVVFLEGEKKTLAVSRLAAHDNANPAYLSIGISGVWNWSGRNGKAFGPNGERIDTKGPIGDLNWIVWKGRRVIILFDTNVHTNESVQAARRMLARELTSRGADVSFVTLPKDCGVSGIDDLLAAWGPDRVLRIFQDAVPAERDRPSQAELLVRLTEDLELFHTSEGEGFAVVRGESGSQALTLSSKNFRHWLTKVAYRKLGKPPGEQALRETTYTLEARATFDSPEAPLFVRIADFENKTYIDLANAQGEVVEVDSTGWRIVVDPPVHFRRPKGSKPLPKPLAGGSINELRPFVNIGDDTNWILFLSWLIASLRGKGPFPILILQGEQGSAKSTTAKLIRMLLDPAVAPARTPPREIRDLLIAGKNSRVLVYDNVSHIQPLLSDALCSISTGGGFSTRELFTNDEEVLFDVSRPVVLNGITRLATRSDLIERAVILELPSIADENRKEEAELHREFHEALPRILGAMFSCLSRTLARLPQVKLAKLPRMADFAKLATAAEEPLGFAQGSFSAAYSDNRAEAILETLEADSVADALIAMMTARLESGESRWRGTTKQLKAELETFLEGGTAKTPEWPQTPRGLSAHLRRLVTFLRQSAIRIVFPKKKSGKGQRIITLEIGGTDETATSATPPTGSSRNHSDTTQPAGGGRDEQGDDVPLGSDQPPPSSAVADPLSGLENQARVAEVAIVAVSDINGRDDSPQTTNGPRIDLCSLCGRNDWEWDGGRWICRHCNTPAGHRAPMERIEL